MKTKRELGKHLEEYVSAYLREVLNDDSIRPTKASGASTQLGDIMCKKMLIECKYRSTKSITIKEEVWNKLVAEIPINSIRIPVYVLGNQNGKIWAVLDFKDLCDIIKEK